MKHYPSVLHPLSPLPWPLSPPCLPLPSPDEAAATCALQVDGWWLHCWTESDARGAVIPAVINISGRSPCHPSALGHIPSSLLHVKYPRATLSPHFNYSLKVISGWNQGWSWAELKMFQFCCCCCLQPVSGDKLFLFWKCLYIASLQQDLGTWKAKI